MKELFREAELDVIRFGKNEWIVTSGDATDSSSQNDDTEEE